MYADNRLTERSLRSSSFTPDWVVLLIYLVLLVFGWISICGATHEIGDTDFLSWSTRTGKQVVWIGCALALGFVIMMTDDRYFDTLAGLFYCFMLVLLLITPFVAKDIKGSLSWIKIGSVSIQPAEFAKCATALALAKMMSQYGFALNNMRNLAKAAGVVLLPMLLIVMQKETGSALVFLAFFLMFYREGMPGSFLFVGTAAVVYFIVGVRFSTVELAFAHTSVGEFVVLLLIWLFSAGLVATYCPRTPHARRILIWGGAATLVAVLFSAFVVPFDIAWVQVAVCFGISLYLGWQALGERIGRYFFISMFALCSTAFLYSADYALNNILEPHQQTRVRVLLGMEENLTGAGYNVNQSKIAIGSGGLKGKGFMNGTQTKLKYVPEQDTDFIFCTVGEEEGFIGSAAVLLLFLGLIWRLIYLSERQSTKFGRIYGYCVVSILFFHVLINVGMVMGLMPVIGIPLPFFSYGGSSLWGFTFMLFIFLRIDASSRQKLK